MNTEYFRKSLLMIETIDSYIREIDTTNIDYYDDFYPFIDEDDISLYKDVDKDVIINYTVGIFLKSGMESKKKVDIFLIMVTSYILSIKYITDCTLYKGYNFIINFLREFNDDVIDINDRDIDNKKMVNKMMKLEWIILNKINFFTKNEI